MDRRCVIGVDLGGTNVRAQALFQDGTPAGHRYEQKSNAQQGTERILDALAGVIRQATASAEQPPEAVGIAIPGHVDDDSGLVRWAPNFGYYEGEVFHYWQDVPITQPLRQKLGMAVTMGNDANLAALGEYQFGSGRGSAKCLVMVTIGTGIGGGVVFGPQSLQGPVTGPVLLLGGNKGGAELGHTIIQQNGLDCRAGTYGAIEAYCQKDAIIQRAQHKLRRGRASLIHDMVDGDLNNLTPHLLTEACEKGDALALEVYREVGVSLGVGLGNFINLFAPDILAVGGQIAKAGRFLLEPAIDAAENVAIPSLFADCTIRQAEHIDDAGILGGAALALQKG